VTDISAAEAAVPLLASAPQWFGAAVAIEPEHRSLVVDGATIRYAIWGRGRGKPALALVHGSAAHLRWWSFVAPFLTDRWEVLALELSGNGDSGWRDDYDVTTRADEVLAVCREAGYFERAAGLTLAGHRFGSVCSVHAAARAPERFQNLILLDPPLIPPGQPYPRGDRAPKPHRVYATVEEAVGRFKLYPPQPLENDYIIDYVARWSLKPVPAAAGGPGWTWKFDPAIYAKAPPQDLADHLNSLRGAALRVGLLHGTLSPIVTPERIGFVRETFAGWGPMVPIHDAHHHLMLDQPRPFATALRTMLTCLADA
jgi:pimeloyl-ACP methyl ester carboxylesterase